MFLGENFRVGWKFLVRSKILGLGEIFGFGRNFLVWVKIFGLGENLRSVENFGFGWKFLVQGSHWFAWVHGCKVQGTNYKVKLFGARFPLVHMGSWVQSSKYKLQSGRFYVFGFLNLNLDFAPKFRKNPNFWQKIQIVVWFGVRFNLNAKAEAAAEEEEFRSQSSTNIIIKNKFA